MKQMGNLLNECSQLQDFELEGWWCLPDENCSEMPGILRYKAGERIELELWSPASADTFSALEKQTIAFDSHRSEYPVIHGITVNKTEVTLFNTRNIGVSYGSSATFMAQVLLTGARIDSLEHLKIKTASIGFTNLDLWLRHSHNERDWRTQLQVPAIQADIAFRTVNNERNNYETGETVSRSHSFAAIISDEPQDWEWYSRIIYRLENLLTFFMDKPIFQDYVHLELDDKRIVGCFRSLRLENYQPDRKEFLRYLVKFSDIEKYGNQPFDLYFKTYDQLKWFWVYFIKAVYRNKGLTVEDRFLPLIQGLEAIHRQFLDDEAKYMPTNSFKDIRTRIKDSLNHLVKDVPSGLKKKLINSIHRANSYELPDRLLCVVEKTYMEGGSLLWPVELGVLLEHTVENRNFWIHLQGDPDSPPIDSEKLLIINYWLWTILTLLLGTHLGFEQNHWRNVLIECKRYKEFEHFFEMYQTSLPEYMQFKKECFLTS